MTGERIEIVPIAIGRYADPSLAPLDEGELSVDAVVAKLLAILAEFGGVLRDWHTPMPHRRGDAVDSRLAAWSTSEHPNSVLYWVGHASSDRADPRLQHAGSNERAHLPGVTAERIARAIAPRNHHLDDDHWDVVIIDTCWSAACCCRSCDVARRRGYR